jgi:hypothetical protein
VPCKSTFAGTRRREFDQVREWNFFRGAPKSAGSEPFEILNYFSFKGFAKEQPDLETRTGNY